MIKIKNDDIVVEADDGSIQHFQIGSPEAFQLLSKLWLRSGWDNKYVYSFSWLGRPVIQLPEDMLRIQELIYELQPDVVIETGVAHGGSLVFYASVMQAIGKGRVVGIDIEIRPHNRAAIEQHKMAPLISLIEGSSIDDSTIEKVKRHVRPGEKVLVILDSNHSREHVKAELALYSPLVTVGSYIVACDGIMQDVVGAPRTQPDWDTNNPQYAVKDFLSVSDDFELSEPVFPFNEGAITERVTYWPNAYLKRIK
jgi:cephalosporin hydroxylase